MKTKIASIYILLIGFLLLPSMAIAHSGSIKGIVYDGNSRKPLEGVSIYLQTSAQSAVTDAFGKFLIKDVAPGRYNMAISHLGFKNQQETVKVEDGITAEITINLQSAAVEMNSVSVNAHKALNLGSVSGIDLKVRPVNTTQDLLRLVPGLFIAQHQGGGKAEQIFLRGFDCDHGTDVNVSVDNMPVNMVSHAHGQGFADTHFIIAESVQELDYGKGPYTMDKGNLCTAGFVALKTKNNLDNSFVKAEAGTFGYYRMVAGIKLLDRMDSGSHQDAYIMAEYGNNRSYFDMPQNFNRFNLVGKYTNYINANKILTLTLSGFHSYWDASGQIPERAVQDGIIGRYGGIDPEGGVTSRYNMNLQYFQAIGRDNYFKSNIYLTKYDFSLYSNFTYFAVDSVNGDQIHQAENRVMIGYNGEYSANTSVGKLNMRTQAGLGFRHDEITNDELSHTVGKTLTLENIQLGDIHETNAFGYVNQTIFLTPRLVMNLGTRFDELVQLYDDKHNENNKSTVYSTGKFSPKAGLYYNFSNSARIYYNYGTGFHSNDTRTLALGQQLGAPINIKNTIPQAFSHDLGIIIKPNPKMLVSAAVWMLDLQQEFAYAGDVAVIDTSGRTKRYGLDLSARYQLLKWLYLDMDVNLAHGRAIDQPAGNDYIALAPSITSVGGITLRLNKSTTAGLRYRYIGNRPANDDNTLTALGYMVYDAVVNYSIRHYDFGFQVQNLFNVQWNEAQFATETRLRLPNGTLEPTTKTDVCYTPGTPFFLKVSAGYRF